MKPFRWIIIYFLYLYVFVTTQAEDAAPVPNAKGDAKEIDIPQAVPGKGLVSARSENEF